MNARASCLPLAILALTTACGARTELAVGDGGMPAPPIDAAVDAGIDAGIDAGPPLPPCGTPVPVGSIRFRVPDVVGAPAFGSDGTLFVPVGNPDRSIDVAAYDRCTGEERWRQSAMPPAEPITVRRPAMRWTTAGDLLLANTGGYLGAYGIWRFSPEGEAFGPYEPEGLGDLLAIPRGLGPVAKSRDAGGMVQVSVLDLDGSVRATFEDTLGQGDECAASADTVVCYAGARRLPDGAVIWTDGGTEILDGTFRHVVRPALAGDRLYAIVYGVSTYDLVALDRNDGHRVFREPLMRTARGQTDLRLGRPVVGGDGTLYVYANGHRVAGDHTGELTSWTPSGSIRWTFVADATREAFFEHATHLLGDDGAVYLAIGDAVHALDASDGSVRWELTVPEAVNTPAIALSAAGDLAVRTDDGELLVIATAARGLAASDWPAPGGDERNAEAW